jgi:AsmA protein
MKKLFKIIVIIGLVLVLLILALFVAARWFITPERVRQAVVPLAEKALNRPVSLGHIKISVFSGVSIADVRIGMKDESGDFISADLAVLRYQLIPLLKKQVVLDEVRLERPEIRVIRHADGTFNFSDLLKKSDPQEEKAITPAPAEQKSGAAIDLLVSTVQVKDGVVYFTDKAAEPGDFACQIKQINAAAENISLEKDFPFKVSAVLNKASLDISGRLDPLSAQATADLEIDGLNIADFSAYFSHHLPGRLSSALLGLRTSVSVSKNFVKTGGNLDLREIDLVFDAMPDAPLKKAQMVFDYDFEFDSAEGNLNIGKSVFDFNGISLQAQGSVKNLDKTPYFDLQARLPSTEMKVMLAAVAQGLVRDLAIMEPAGTIRAEVNISGPADKPEALLKSGNLYLDGISASVSGIRPVLTGAIDLSAEKISSDKLELVLGGDNVFIDFSVTDYFSVPVNISSSIYSSFLDIDKLSEAVKNSQNTWKKENQQKKEDGKDKSGPRISDDGRKKTSLGPFDLPLRAKGLIDVKRAVYKGLEVSDMSLRWMLEDNVFVVQTLEAKMAEGQIKGNGRTDLAVEGLLYDADFSVSDFSSDALISGFAPKAAGIFAGKTNVFLVISGKGISYADIQKALSGRGTIFVSEGKIAANALSEELTGVLGIRDLKSIDFKSFDTSFKIDDGKIMLDSVFDGKDIRMKPSGTMGLDGSLNIDLNLSMAPGFSSRLSEDSLAGRLLADGQGWTRLPVSLGGSVYSPEIKLDSALIRRQLQEKAAQEVIEKGLEKLFK